MRDAVETLANAIRHTGDGPLCVVAGAGISLASGIPTFRGTDPGAVLKRDVTGLGARSHFEHDPVPRILQDWGVQRDKL